MQLDQKKHLINTFSRHRIYASLPQIVTMPSDYQLMGGFLGTAAIALGINAILRPTQAIDAFKLQARAEAADPILVNSLVAIYGARDIFVGLTLFVASYFRARSTLGGIILAAVPVVMADGAICRYYVGEGEWAHWGSLPVLVALGAWLIRGASSST
jgi:hypothetical protein